MIFEKRAYTIANTETETEELSRPEISTVDNEESKFMPKSQSVVDIKLSKKPYQFKTDAQIIQ